MKKKIFLKKIVYYLFLNALFLSSCRETAATVSCFPNQLISIQLNLNLPQYTELNYTGGAVYVDGTGSGNMGLIIIRTSTGFMCYDRNAPHICPDATTQLKMVDRLKLLCPKDGAEWILSTGEPIKIAQITPKMYPYQLDTSSNLLSIYN